MRAAFFPSIKSDETVYSICARIAQLPAGVTGNEEFDAHLATCDAPRHIAVPSGLDCLKQVSDGAICATERTLRKRTMLGPYLPLMSHQKRQTLLQACRLCGNSDSALVKAGLNRYPLCDVLKWCRACAEETRKADGFTYWSVDHQLPGTWLCERHQLPLSYVSRPGRDSSWVLPHHCEAQGKAAAPPSETSMRVDHVREVVEWIATRSSLDLRILEVMLRRRLRESGLCRSEFKIKTLELLRLEQVARSCFAKAAAPDIAFINEKAWITAVLRDRRQSNPLIWSMALGFIGETGRPCLDIEYMEAATCEVEPDFSGGKVQRTRERESDLIALRKENLNSCAACHLRLPRQPSSQWLPKDENLRRYWQRNLMAMSREGAINEIRMYLQVNPSARRAIVFENCPSSVRWLERHDRPTLDELVQPADHSWKPQLSLPLLSTHSQGGGAPPPIEAPPLRLPQFAGSHVMGSTP